jgi:hypothetical protein
MAVWSVVGDDEGGVEVVGRGKSDISLVPLCNHT